MATIKRKGGTPFKAMSDEARETEMIALAMDNAEKRLREGTASNQLILHFLELGSSKGRIEREMLENKAELIKEQASAVKEGKETAADYRAALEAFTRYSGKRNDGV